MEISNPYYKLLLIMLDSKPVYFTTVNRFQNILLGRALQKQIYWQNAKGLKEAMNIRDYIPYLRIACIASSNNTYETYNIYIIRNDCINLIYKYQVSLNHEYESVLWKYAMHGFEYPILYHA